MTETEENSKRYEEAESLDKFRASLIQEATELTNIFGAIVRKSE